MLGSVTLQIPRLYTLLFEGPKPYDQLWLIEKDASQRPIILDQASFMQSNPILSRRIGSYGMSLSIERRSQKWIRHIRVFRSRSPPTLLPMVDIMLSAILCGKMPDNRLTAQQDNSIFLRLGTIL